MQPVTINPNNVAAALQTIESASQQNDLGILANNFSFTGTLTDTTDLDLSSPTLANVAAVLATFLSYAQKGGTNRTT